jgi:nucleotide-binding universal stress UspA family protein
MQQSANALEHGRYTCIGISFPEGIEVRVIAMYHKVLVPLDGSVFAEHALPLALEVAQRAQAAVQLVRVHVRVGSPYSGSDLACDLGLDSIIRHKEESYLRNVRQRLATVSPVRLTHKVLDGPAAAALYQHALATSTDLVVMTTHGRGPLTRCWLGSVADQLVRQVSVPVLLVRPREGARERTWKPILQHVLIPLDGSELAEEILEPAHLSVIAYQSGYFVRSCS